MKSYTHYVNISLILYIYSRNNTLFSRKRHHYVLRYVTQCMWYMNTIRTLRNLWCRKQKPSRIATFTFNFVEIFK